MTAMASSTVSLGGIVFKNNTVGPDLKECPMCGAEASAEREALYGIVRIFCPLCGLEMRRREIMNIEPQLESDPVESEPAPLTTWTDNTATGGGYLYGNGTVPLFSNTIAVWPAQPVRANNYAVRYFSETEEQLVERWNRRDVQSAIGTVLRMPVAEPREKEKAT